MFNSQCSIPNAQFSAEVDVGLRVVRLMQDADCPRTSKADMSLTRSCGQEPLESQLCRGTWSGTVWIRIMAKRGTLPDGFGIDQIRSDSCGLRCSDKN